MPAVPADRPALVYLSSGTGVIQADVPLAAAGQLVALPEGVFINTPGYTKLNAVVVDFQNVIALQDQHIAELEAQNTTLAKALDTYAAEPTIDPKRAVIVGVGLAVLGAAAGAAAVIAVQGAPRMVHVP